MSQLLFQLFSSEKVTFEFSARSSRTLSAAWEIPWLAEATQSKMDGSWV